MTNLKNAQDILAVAALCSDPAARRIMEVAAATQMLDDPAAKRGAEQALSLALTGAAAESVSNGMSNSQAGVFRDLAVERDGAVVARFVGGNADTVLAYGDRFIHRTADAPALPPPTVDAVKLAAE